MDVQVFELPKLDNGTPTRQAEVALSLLTAHTDCEPKCRKAKGHDAKIAKIASLVLMRYTR